MTKPSKDKTTMTVLLRKAIADSDSLRSTAKAAGVEHSSLVRFVSGRQSLRLDLADKLAAYFGIECVQRKAR
jgi:plasmid maintenance system antidote protein VapI